MNVFDRHIHIWTLLVILRYTICYRLSHAFLFLWSVSKSTCLFSWLSIYSTYLQYRLFIYIQIFWLTHVYSSFLTHIFICLFSASLVGGGVREAHMYPVLMFYLFLCLSRYGRRIHVSPFIKFVSQESPFGTVFAHKNGPGGLPMRASRPWQRFGLSKRGLLIQVDRNLLWRNPGISYEMGICAYRHTMYIQCGRKFATVSSHAGC